MMINVLLILTSIVVGGLRLLGIKTIFYQAIAHVFVGALFGAYFQSGHARVDGVKGAPLCLWLGIGLTVLEVVAAFTI